jgi:hypothetical protein
MPYILRTEALALGQPLPRRAFFTYLGTAAGIGALALASCSDDTDVQPASITPAFGTGDVSILNFIYTFEQLQAAFYTQVLARLPLDVQADDRRYFQQLAQHQAIHRDLLARLIERDFPGQRLPLFTFNFSSVDFAQRSAVLSAAKTLEDLGVSAYNGVLPKLATAAYLTLLAGMSSVEARHSALISDLITLGTFANTANSNGLDVTRTPVAALALIQPYIRQTLDGGSIGT